MVRAKSTVSTMEAGREGQNDHIVLGSWSAVGVVSWVLEEGGREVWDGRWGWGERTCALGSHFDGAVGDFGCCVLVVVD